MCHSCFGNVKILVLSFVLVSCILFKKNKKSLPALSLFLVTYAGNRLLTPTKVQSSRRCCLRRSAGNPFRNGKQLAFRLRKLRSLSLLGLLPSNPRLLQGQYAVRTAYCAFRQRPTRCSSCYLLPFRVS